MLQVAWHDPALGVCVCDSSLADPLVIQWLQMLYFIFEKGIWLE